MSASDTFTDKMSPLTSRGKFLIVVGGAGLAARILLSACSYGTNDTTSWEHFAAAIRAAGLSELYSKEALFNHPPLAALMAALLHWFSEIAMLPFPFMLRLPGILAELGSGYLVWLILLRCGNLNHAAAAFAAFGTSLVSILVSGYHGNTDCVYAFLGFLGAWALAEKRSFMLGGFLLGAAVNVKLIPVLLLPALFVSCPNLEAKKRFISGFLAAMLPFLVMLVFAGAPFARNVFAYNSQRDFWGFQLFLLLFYGNFPDYRDLFMGLADLYAAIGRYVVVAAIIIVCAMNSRRKNLDAFELCALCYALFAVFAPGFGGQYFVIFPAFLLTFSVKWALRISLLAGLVQLASYAAFMVSIFPLRSEHTATAGKFTVLFAFFAWTALAVLAGELVRKLVKGAQGGSGRSGEEIS